MSEKLIIKNFGPIKSVELDLKKVTVLIGEQGTGKSAIAKLLYVLSNYFFLFGTDDERNTIIESYGLFFKIDTRITYTTDYYSVVMEEGKFAVELQDNVKEAHEDIKLKPNPIIINWFDNQIGDYKYVPAERIALTPIVRMLNLPSRTLYRGGFDEFIVDFAGDYDLARKNITEYTIPHLNNVVFKMVNGIEKIVFNKEELFLYQTSSGFQVSIPVVIFIEYYTRVKYVNKFIVEEPELNLFPSAQNEVVKFLINKIAPKDNNIFINTHSPYILTSLNNLIYAYKIGQTYPEEIEKIIDKKYWLNPDDVSVYMLHSDGTCEDIFDREESSISSEKIDGVSRVINAQFDSMLNIEFGITNEKA